ncbi:MAG TPA: efflux RND transporter periplasmic adaptor subunit [Nitrospirales bacterium]|nr:efflux RND transporter periplasmic adaptor subunit [Nitrospirales bacterium]
MKPFRLLALLLASVALSACSRSEEPNAAAPAPQAPALPALENKIETMTVSTSAVRPVLTLAGKVAYGEDRYSKISSPLQGRVLEVRARLGDHVKAGDVLLEIDSPDIAQAYSEFVKEHSDLTFAQRAYELAKDLYETKALALKDLKLAENDLVKAQAEFRRARERLLSLRVPASELDKPLVDQKITSRFQMRSPLTGTVVERTVTPGQSVGGDPTQVLFTVADLARLQVVADVYERDLGMVHVGQVATVTVEAYAGVQFPAAIAAIGDVVDQNTRTIKVRAWVSNEANKLKPEMFARLNIDLGDGASFIAVPKEAVLEIDGKEYVYVVEADGKYARHLVKVGSASADQLRILEGLKLGDRVVTKGAILLKAKEAKG